MSCQKLHPGITTRPSVSCLKIITQTKKFMSEMPHHYFPRETTLDFWNVSGKKRKGGGIITKKYRWKLKIFSAISVCNWHNPKGIKCTLPYLTLVLCALTNSNIVFMIHLIPFAIVVSGAQLVRDGGKEMSPAYFKKLEENLLLSKTHVFISRMVNISHLKCCFQSI